MRIKNICCIGAGYVGGPTMSVIADKCKHLIINVVDVNKEKINSWNHSDLSCLPVYEPGLEDLIFRTRNKNLFFSNDIESCIKNADMIFISVNTPTKEHGLGAGEASDLKWVEASARQVKKFSKGKTIVVEKSTLPVKTAEMIKSILLDVNDKESFQEKQFSILSNPEFLSEGSAISDLENPDRILIGGEDKYAIESLAEIYKNWVPEEKIVRTNIWSSELSKLASNAFLAQRISSINSLAAFCEISGADINEVSRSIGLDSRIGKYFLQSSPGFGGSCFKKDILNLVYLCKNFGLYEVADYWEQVININIWQKNRIYKLIAKSLFNTLSNKKIAILGFSFKANTNDTRESPSIDLTKNLLLEKANVYINDPKVKEEQIEKDLGYRFDKLNNSNDIIDNQRKTGLLIFSSDVYECIKNADAVVVMTEWDIYKNIDWLKCESIMRKPAWVFDTRYILNKNDFNDLNINFWQIGNGAREDLKNL